MIIFFEGELRMNPEDKKFKKSNDESSLLYPLFLVVSMIIGIILVLLKMIGVF